MKNSAGVMDKTVWWKQRVKSGHLVSQVREMFQIGSEQNDTEEELDKTASCSFSSWSRITLPSTSIFAARLLRTSSRFYAGTFIVNLKGEHWWNIKQPSYFHSLSLIKKERSVFPTSFPLLLWIELIPLCSLQYDYRRLTFMHAFVSCSNTMERD